MWSSPGRAVFDIVIVSLVKTIEVRWDLAVYGGEAGWHGVGLTRGVASAVGRAMTNVELFLLCVCVCASEGKGGATEG
jgi:hypothetical protein